MSLKSNILFVVIFLIAAAGSCYGQSTRGQVSTLYGSSQQLSVIGDEEIRESSGVARSSSMAGAFWTHNDSGDQPRLFLIGEDGKTLARCAIRGAKANDWEDICSFQLDGQNYLLIGDIGDNAAKRKSVKLYFVQEPTFDKSGPLKATSLPVHSSIEFNYEGGPCNCEAIGVDVPSGKVLLASKHKKFQCTVYELPLSGQRGEHRLVAKPIATLGIPTVTAMDISADGRRMVILTYLDALLYERGAEETWTTALKRMPQLVVLPKRKQGESICFGHDGRSLYLTSEGVSQPFWKIPFSGDEQ